MEKKPDHDPLMAALPGLGGISASEGGAERIFRDALCEIVSLAHSVHDLEAAQEIAVKAIKDAPGVGESAPLPSGGSDAEFLRAVVSKPHDAVSALEFMRVWGIANRALSAPSAEALLQKLRDAREQVPSPRYAQEIRFENAGVYAMTIEGYDALIEAVDSILSAPQGGTPQSDVDRCYMAVRVRAEGSDWKRGEESLADWVSRKLSAQSASAWSDEDRRLASFTAEKLLGDWTARAHLTHHQGDLIFRALRSIADGRKA